MTSRPLTLRPWQIAALQQNRLSLIVLPLKPQPADGARIALPKEWDSGRANDAMPAFATWGPRQGYTLIKEPGRLVYAKKLPFAPGERLWVRESHFIDKDRTLGIVNDQGVAYRADWSSGVALRWRSPVTMPRWASRFTLTVTGVAVKRLQEVTEEARDAGFRGNASGPWGCEGLMQDFEEQWATDHGPGAWDANPFCLFAQVEEKNNG